MGTFFSELKRRKVLRVAAAYIVASWVLLQVADVLASILELPAWAAKLTFFVLIIGFIPALILAWAYDVTPEGVEVTPRADGGAAGSRKVPLLAAMLIVVVGIVGTSWWYSGKDFRWARDVAMPQVEEFVAAGDYESAYTLAIEIESVLPDHPGMQEIWKSFAWKMSIPSSPEGAKVYRRAYSDPDAEWQFLGVTPVHETRIPRGLSLLRFEADGLEPALRAIGGGIFAVTELPVENEPRAGFANVMPGSFRLYASDQIPVGMVHVPGWTEVVDGEAVTFSDFFLGRHEVTNGQFQAFVDAGGYGRRDLWEHEFVDDETILTFGKAMEQFVDRTGRPGPAIWEAGTYPEGKADHPVTGISWYEAAAYARFARFELPTVGHWRRALAMGLLAWEVPASNLESDGTVPVGSLNSIGWTGTYDMAGNAREWCFNEAGDRQRVIVGGGWNDLSYYVENSVEEPHRVPPMNRSETNGLRLMSSIDEASARKIALRPVVDKATVPIPAPVSDEVFAAKARDYDYDKKALNATVEKTVDFRHWTRQLITFDGEQGEDRIPLYLYLPKNNMSRHQTVLFWPGATSQFLESVDDYPMTLGFLLRNGRAVAFPVLKGMYERRMPAWPDWTTHSGRNLAIEEVRELRRVIDYLETRPDIEADNLGYYGLSWGGRVGAIVLAVEPRIKTAVLNQAGINAGDHPDINVVNFLPRVTVPVLHFSGLYDTDFQFETSSKPFFERLGTPAADKKHVVEPTGHFVPPAIVKGETLDWLDKYLGPVE